jgi:hypothetical protein
MGAAVGPDEFNNPRSINSACTARAVVSAESTIVIVRPMTARKAEASTGK